MNETENKEPETEVIDAELDETKGQALEVINETIAHLARQGQQGIAIIQAREAIVDAAVRASIRLTHPSDWVLFKDKAGKVTAYLQDSGCKRINRIWGIQVTQKRETKVQEGPHYAWILIGDAYCSLTDSWEYDLEGIRYSNEPYVSSVTEPLKRSTRVHQAARANLDGTAVRKLSGLGNVPEAFLNEVWRGSDKSTKQCSQGRGFGTQQDREGIHVRSDETPDNIPAPICDSCGAELQYMTAGSNASGKWDAYWKCRQYMYDQKKREGNGHSRMSAADWEKVITAKQTEALVDGPVNS